MAIGRLCCGTNRNDFATRQVGSRSERGRTVQPVAREARLEVACGTLPGGVAGVCGVVGLQRGSCDRPDDRVELAKRGGRALVDPHFTHHAELVVRWRGVLILKPTQQHVATPRLQRYEYAAGGRRTGIGRQNPAGGFDQVVERRVRLCRLSHARQGDSGLEPDHLHFMTFVPSVGECKRPPPRPRQGPGRSGSASGAGVPPCRVAERGRRTRRRSHRYGRGYPRRRCIR